MWMMLLSSLLFLSERVTSTYELHRIGVAIGPQTWFGDHFGANVSSSGRVLNNRFTGAFGYGIAITSAQNFTVQGNALFGNTSFIDSRGPNCSASDPTPPSAAFIVEWANVTTSALQSDFQSVQDAKGLTCVQPPDGGDFWPYGGNPSSGGSTPPVPVPSPSSSPGSTPTSLASQGSGGLSSAGTKTALAIGIIVAVVALILVIILFRRWALKRELEKFVPRADYASNMKR
jgi:parallel beta-helix repeat protein